MKATAIIHRKTLFKDYEIDMLATAYSYLLFIIEIHLYCSYLFMCVYKNNHIFTVIPTIDTHNSNTYKEQNTSNYSFLVWKEVNFLKKYRRKKTSQKKVWKYLKYKIHF